MAKIRVTPVIVTVIPDGGTTEIRWGTEEVKYAGYVLVHEDCSLTVTFRGPHDEPFVFVLDENGGRVVATEDQPPSADDEVLWEA